VTLSGEISRPFLVRGVSADELHRDVWRPDDVPELDRTIDERIDRRPVADTLADHLRRGRRTERTRTTGADPGARTVRQLL
jgi:hypothetical protein